MPKGSTPRHDETARNNAPSLFARLRPHRLTGVLTAVVLGIVLLPIGALLVIAFSGGNTTLPHLASTVLPRALEETGLLMAIVAAVTLTCGVTSAWLTVMCRFPGRQVLSIALLLPLAIPTYVSAFAWLEFLDYSGPVQEIIRHVLGVRSARDYWFPAYRSTWGAGVFLGLVLYPYVYLTCRLAFLTQSSQAIDVARTLGARPLRVFTRVTLPLARPAMVAGVTLALMETLNDIGAVEFFGVQTLTLSVYSTWLNRGDLAGAAQLALIILSVVIILLAAERWARGQQKYGSAGKREHGPKPFALKGWKGWLATLACAAPVLFGFAIPAGQLAGAAIRRFPENMGGDYWLLVGNSLKLALIAAIATTVIATLFAYVRWRRPRSKTAGSIRLATVGYAVPGTVLALGILIPLARFDNAVDAVMRETFGISTGLMLTGSLFALSYAYVVRFMAVGFGAMETGFSRLSPNLDMAARALGAGAFKAFWRVELPLLRPALATASLLVFVDVMKELPTSLLLRPFNFETLATHVYGQASLALFEEGAMAALTIVAVGIIPVLTLSISASSGLVQKTRPTTVGRASP